VFDAQAFLDSAGVARKVKEFKRAEAVYSQGDAANSVMYLQEGGVKLTVISSLLNNLGFRVFRSTFSIMNELCRNALGCSVNRGA
jgi:CRP-like cAMP-binding protein